jgi:excisionase family DNA binding protein
LFETYDDIITIDDLMDMLNIGRNYAYELLRSGKIKSFKIGKVYKIPKISIQQFIQEQAPIK